MTKDATLQDKRVLLAITGSIAAYKSILLIRLLIKAGAEVRVVMTPSAADFVTPLTLSTLSKHQVYWDVSDGDTWNNHVELGLWADALIIAPCTANTLAKMATGQADNMVLAVYLSARCPVWVAPAMDLDMYHHPATQRTLDTLASDGVRILPSPSGELASGLSGEGRMSEPEDIIAWLRYDLYRPSDQRRMRGQQVLITAGPTHEAIDQVRFIGNRSSGRMGRALAIACAIEGANVELILGPSTIQMDLPGITVTRVQSAEDMLQAAVERFDKMDISIMCAAVADYRPAVRREGKWKKGSSEDLSIRLEETTDIAATLGASKQPHQHLIGFALEADDGMAAAKKKLDKKNLDLIVLNSLADEGAGFGGSTNKVTLVTRDHDPVTYPLKSKLAVAKDIIECIIDL